MENKKEKTKFEQLTAVDCSAHIEKKNTGKTSLSYLSWAWAWDYFKKAYPDAKYEIKEWDGKPYLFDEKQVIWLKHLLQQVAKHIQCGCQ